MVDKFLIAILKTEDGKEYDIYSDGKNKFINFKDKDRLILGSATNRKLPNEIMGLEPEGVKSYKFTKELKSGYFILLKNNDINDIKRIKEIIPVKQAA